jgi:hypothetical protein
MNSLAPFSRHVGRLITKWWSKSIFLKTSGWSHPLVPRGTDCWLCILSIVLASERMELIDVLDALLSSSTQVGCGIGSGSSRAEVKEKDMKTVRARKESFIVRV